MSGEQTEEQLAAAIVLLVEQELTRFGLRGTLRIEGDALVLRSRAGEARAEIRGTLAQWESLPDDLRERRIRQIAGLLAEKNPAAAPRFAQTAPTPATRRQSRLRWYTVFAPISIAALTALAIAVAYRTLAPRGEGFSLLGASASPSGSGATAGPVDPDRERFFLASSACEHTRARVAQGAAVGPADSEGWVVELALLRRGASVDLSRAPGLAKFITRKAGDRAGTLTWGPATHLAAVQRFDAKVAVDASEPLGDSRVSGLDLVFSGPYVLPYFSEDQRADYFKLADALADELGATGGALFARCANSKSHHIGSWFLGATPGEAASSLVYFMAGFTDVPQLKPSVLGQSLGEAQHGHTFDAISRAAANMSRNAAATLIGRELGVVSSGPDHGLRLSFPFRDANRSTRASVGVARALGLANSG